MILEACGKINWSLDITGLREDGYHLMDMLMQPVTLSDTITLLPGEDLSLVSEGFPKLKADDRHLALRAARLLKEQKINVTQVAYTVGFSNLAHFSTIFRKHFGVSPSEYAEREA